MTRSQLGELSAALVKMQAALATVVSVVGQLDLDDDAPAPAPARNGHGQTNGFHREAARPARSSAPPLSGGIYGWAKDNGGDDLVKHLERFGKRSGFQGMMKNWSPSEVELAYAEGCRFLDK